MAAEGVFSWHSRGPDRADRPNPLDVMREHAYTAVILSTTWRGSVGHGPARFV
jgi:hypothetical protein